MGIIIAVVVFLGIMGTMGFFIMKVLKKTKTVAEGTSIPNSADNTQTLLPFDRIQDSMIHLNNGQYRVVMECSCVDYRLKTEAEQNIIDLSWQRVLNTLDHPISLYIQTRTMDNRKMMDSLEKDTLKAIEDYPGLQNYGQVYYSEMAHLYDSIGNNKEKKKYIIIPYAGANDLTFSTEEERYNFCIEQMQNRCGLIMENLGGVGIHANILSTPQLIELMYSVFHKNQANQTENLDSFLKSFQDTSSNEFLHKVSPQQELDLILYQAQEKLCLKLEHNANLNPWDVQIAEKSIRQINELRKEILNNNAG